MSAVTVAENPCRRETYDLMAGIEIIGLWIAEGADLPMTHGTARVLGTALVKAARQAPDETARRYGLTVKATASGLVTVIRHAPGCDYYACGLEGGELP